MTDLAAPLESLLKFEHLSSMTDLAAALESLLKFVLYHARSHPSGTKICSCCKNGHKCVTACGDCRSEGCKSIEEIFDEESGSKTTLCHPSLWSN